MNVMMSAKRLVLVIISTTLSGRIIGVYIQHILLGSAFVRLFMADFS